MDEIKELLEAAAKLLLQAKDLLIPFVLGLKALQEYKPKKKRKKHKKRKHKK